MRPDKPAPTAPVAALLAARPIASPMATLCGLLHLLEATAEDAACIGLVQSANGLGALSRFAIAEFQARHGQSH